jgi:hypothetical protein
VPRAEPLGSGRSTMFNSIMLSKNVMFDNSVMFGKGAPMV